MIWDQLIYEANRTSKALARVKIAERRSESIERVSRPLFVNTKTPLHGAFLNLIARGGMDRWLRQLALRASVGAPRLG